MASPAESRADSPGPLLEARGQLVEFPGVRALDGVDFSVTAGEVHALLGENGAGKSTLINILSGLIVPRSGEVRVSGSLIRPRSPADAEAAGISTVHQEIDLIPTLSVAENICLGRMPTRLGLIGWKRVRERARHALARLGVELDVRRAAGSCSIAQQQLVAISRALDIDSRVLILDEPTSSLDAAEAGDLLDTVRRLRGQGLGIVFITHFLDQVYGIADRITVLRNGRRVGTWPTAQLGRPALVEAMTGRSIGTLAKSSMQPADSASEPVLETHALGRMPAIAPVSTSIGRGEALGIAGLLGSGRTELARLIFGADRPDHGEVRVQGRRVRPGSVRSAVAAGIAMTPEDRKVEGLILDLSVRENIILAMQGRRGALRPIPGTEQRRLAEHYIASLNIRTPSPETPLRSLSGGNQQKVLLARWLAIQPRILILDEPTRGIDIGARAEIESLISGLREQGLSIVLISAEIDEIERICGRVLVLRDRRCIGELAGEDATEAGILRLIAAPGGSAA